MGHYESFFITSAGASAAILGLLVVAVSVVNADDANPTTRELRTVLAGSAFVALVDIFLVSIVALTGGSVVFGLSSLAMAAIGLLATVQLIPRARRAGNFSRGVRARTLNIAFASISVGSYSAQLGLAAALLANTRSTVLQSALVLVIVALYGSALVPWPASSQPERDSNGHDQSPLPGGICHPHGTYIVCDWADPVSESQLVQAQPPKPTARRP